MFWSVGIMHDRQFPQKVEENRCDVLQNKQNYDLINYKNKNFIPGQLSNIQWIKES